MACSSSNGQNEQIYLVDILIDKLALTPNRDREIAGRLITIQIILGFLNFHLFNIKRIRRMESSTDKERFMEGGCLLFIMKPQDLVYGLRTTKLKIGMFCDRDNFPTAKTESPIDKSFCDQIEAMIIGPEEWPRPASITGDFDLLDPGGESFGKLLMELRIQCVGRYHVPRYEVYSKCEHELKTDWELCLRRFVLNERFSGNAFEKIDIQEAKRKRVRKKDKK